MTTTPPKTKKELEQQNVELIELLRKTMEPKPSTVRQLWDMCKPYVIPFVLGMMFGIMSVAVCGLPTAVFSPKNLERQAALGGAAVPFWNDSPLPSPWNSPLGDWMLAPTDSLSMNISEPPSQANPQADAGQKKSINSSRPLTRRVR